MPKETKRFWSRRWFWTAGGLFAGAATIAAVAPVAWAFRGLPGRGFLPHAVGGGGWGGHGHGRGGFAAQMLKDPAAAKEHVASASEFVLRSVSATTEQKQKTRQITDRLIDQLGPLAERHHELHAAIVTELSKPQIDRAAIEKLRQDGLALADEASRIAVDGVADIGEVLTPEQRVELIDLGRRLHGHGPMR
jgi:Spy/CpxP family protein refolding chaperone